LALTGGIMKRLILTLVAFTAATPALAGAALWSNIESAMTVAQVHALYPSGGHVRYHDDETVISDYVVTGNCQADVHIDHPAGVVTRVRVRGAGSLGGRCSETVLTGLSSRYGQPLSRERNGGSILAREGSVYVWNRPDGVTLRFKRYTNGALGGGGLGHASWELTYSTVTEEINL